MQDQLIIKGFADGTFKPNLSISRKHVAALLERVLPLEPVKDAVEFKDVPASHPYYNSIQKAQQAGIFDGGVDGKFHPEAPTSHWGNEHVRALYSMGLLLVTKDTLSQMRRLRANIMLYPCIGRWTWIKPEAVDPNPQPEPDQDSNPSTGSKSEPKPDTDSKPGTKPSNPNVSKTCTEAEIQKLTAKEFNDPFKGNSFFETSDGVPATEQSFGNKDFIRMLVNMEELVKTKYPEFQVLRHAGFIYLQEPDYTNEWFEQDQIDDNRITEVYKDIEGFELIRIGTSRFQVMFVDIKRNWIAVKWVEEVMT